MKKLVAIGENGRRIGEDHPKAKLSNAQIDEIFSLRQKGKSYMQIARIFNVSKASIQHILHCRTRAQFPVRFKKVVE